MSYSLNYKANWISTEGVRKVVSIYRKNYNGLVQDLEVTNATLNYSKSDAPIDQVIKGKRFTLTVLTEGDNLRFFKDAEKDEFIIIFTVDGKDRFSGFYENTGYFEKYGNDKYDIDLFFIDGFVFGNSIFYTDATDTDITLGSILNTIFVAIDPQAILNASASVDINENNNFFITIDGTDIRFDFKEVVIRNIFFTNKSYTQIISEIFGSTLSSVFYVNNKLYSYSLLNTEDKLLFNNYTLNGISETSFSVKIKNFLDILFTDGYVLEFTDSYNRVELKLPYDSVTKILGSAFDLSESNFIATGSNSPDGSNYDIWDVDFYPSDSFTDVRLYKTSDKDLDLGFTPLLGSFAFSDSQLGANSGGVTILRSEYLDGANTNNITAAGFFPALNNSSSVSFKLMYLFKNSFTIRKGSYLPASYGFDFNKIRMKVSVEAMPFVELDEDTKINITCIPQIVVSGGDDLYLIFDNTFATGTYYRWVTQTQAVAIGKDIVQDTSSPVFSAIHANYTNTNEYTEEVMKYRLFDLTGATLLDVYQGIGEDAFFELPASIINVATSSPENVEIILNFGCTYNDIADNPLKYVLFNNIKLSFYDMDESGDYVKISESTSKQGQGYAKTIGIHTESGFTDEYDLPAQDILAFNNQDLLRTNFPYIFTSVDGNTRKFPFANNDTTGDFQTIEENVSDKLLNLSGKEKITFQTKEYLNENTIFYYKGFKYIISSQSINESTDSNSVQIIRIDE